MTDCSCKVRGPEYGDVTFDPSCPFHGDEGTMVALVERGRMTTHNDDAVREVTRQQRAERRNKTRTPRNDKPTRADREDQHGH